MDYGGWIENRTTGNIEKAGEKKKKKITK